jgi:hypothetical protein
MYDEVADMLRAKPGTWAMIREGVNGGVAHHARMKLGDGFEVVSRDSRRDGNGVVVDVYARFTQ